MLVLLMAVVASVKLSGEAVSVVRPAVASSPETTIVRAPRAPRGESPARPLALAPETSLAPVAPLAPLDTPRARPRAIEYSDWYNTRLTIHRWGSYVELPLFAAEYALGNTLYTSRTPPASWVRTTHRGVAYGLGALFTVNTVTGAWNLWESRDDPSGRTRKYLHTALMLASDAGFAWAGAVGSGARYATTSTWRRHRNIALGSIGVATVGTAMMWLWNQ